jgi:hypothetical protein
MKKLVTGIAVLVVGMWLTGSTPAFAQAGQDKQAPPAAAPEKDKAKDQDKAKDAGAPADVVTGEWDGAVDAGGNTIGFTLRLKLDKDKVTGEIASEQGAVPLTDGGYADSKLTVAFNYVDGTPVTLSGAIADGQMTGTLSYGGQPMGFAAKKRAAK